MSKHALCLSCAVAALVATPGRAQTTGGATPTQQATTATPADASTSASPANAAADATADQEQTADDGGRRRARVEERDVVVTGSRFQKLLEQPQSKSIINAEDRNLAGVGNVRQLIQVQPGFNYSDAFGLNVRGVGRQTAQTLLGQENTVIQYVDGFINLVPSNIAESTLFGGNIQFIRGPSGTTGGRNSLAGSVNLLSRAPTQEFTGEVEAGFGRNNYTDVGANISGPITGNLGFRVGLQELNSPTVFRNLAGRTLDSKKPGFATKSRYIEFQLEWRPGPFHIRNRLTNFEYDNQPGYPTVGRYNSNLPNGNPAAVFGGLSPNPQYAYPGPTPDDPYEINVDFAGYDRLRHNLQDIVNADLDLGFASLVYVGGYQRYKATGSADLDQTSRASYDSALAGPPNPAQGFFGFAPQQVPTDYRSNYDNNNHFQSHEVRLESKPGGAVSWVTGLYYFNQHFNEHYYENIPGATNAIVTGGGVGNGGTFAVPNPLKATFEQRNIYDIRSTAVFGNITADLTSHIRFDGGLRYTWDEKEALTNFRYVYYYPPAYAADVSPPIHSANPFRRDRGLSGRAALAYRFSPGNEIYATYQRGYQASAFTLGQGLPPYNIADDEHLDVYEVGGFATAGRVRFDGSVFYQNFFDQQIPVSTRNTLTTTSPTGVTTTSLGPVFTQFTNAPLSRIYGAEAQVTFRPNDHSNIVASYTYLHPTFERFSGVVDISETCPGANIVAATGLCTSNPLYGVPQDLAGKEIPRTPRHKATLYGYYAINLGSAGFLYPGGSFSYQSSQFANAFNATRFRIPGRAITGLTLTYRTPGEHLDITGSVTNLFRNRYADSLAITAYANGTTNTVTTYGADRYWTVTGRYRF